MVCNVVVYFDFVVCFCYC